MNAEGIEKSLSTLFPRLEGIGGLLGALTDYRPLQVIIEVRQTPTRILLDLAARPVRVTVGGAGLEGDVGLAGTPEDLHQTFTGALGIMAGISQRRLLLRGSMGNLVLMFPVVDQLPVMYGEHIEGDDGTRPRPGAVKRLLARAFDGMAGVFTYLTGRVLRRLGRSDVLKALAAMSYGAARYSDTVQVKNPFEAGEEGPSNLLNEPRAPLWRRIWLGILTRKMYWAGVLVSLLKHRLGIPVDVFAVMGRFSHGVGRPQLPPGGEDS